MYFQGINRSRVLFIPEFCLNLGSTPQPSHDLEGLGRLFLCACSTSDALLASLLKDISQAGIGLCQEEIEDMLLDLPTSSATDVRGLSVQEAIKAVTECSSYLILHIICQISKGLFHMPCYNMPCNICQITYQARKSNPDCPL